MMHQCFFAVFHETNVAPTLLEGLQRLDMQYGDFKEIGIATLMEGRVQSQNTYSLQLLQKQLPEQPLSGHFGMAYTCSKSPEDVEKPYSAHLCANERFAIAYHGVIENRQPEWLDIDTQTDGEIFLTTLDHYLEIDGISPFSAMTLTIKHLQGCFAVMALFAKEDFLIVAHRDCQVAISVNEDLTELSWDTNALIRLSRRVTLLKKKSLTVLYSVKGRCVN